MNPGMSESQACTGIWSTETVMEEEKKNTAKHYQTLQVHKRKLTSSFSSFFTNYMGLASK